MLSITDVLKRRDDGWFLWEAKSSTHEPDKDPKALYDWDLAFQVHVARIAGLDVVGAGLLLLKANFERGKGEPAAEALIVRLDRTETVMTRFDTVASELATLRAEISGDKPPSEWPAPRCKASRVNTTGDRPSTCGHLKSSGECGRYLPKYWAGTLPNLKGSKAEYIAGTRHLPIDRLDPADPDRKWTKDQQRVIRAIRDEQPEICREALRRELDKLEWPVTHVDFEFDPGEAAAVRFGIKLVNEILKGWGLEPRELDEPPQPESRSDSTLGNP